MMEATIYHNPRCSKSRQALDILTQKGASVTEVRYLDTPPTVEALDHICQALSIEPQQLIRTKEALFKELGLSIDDLRTREEWLKILHDHPKLIERPIVQIGDRMVIGRPPEQIETLFE